MPGESPHFLFAQGKQLETEGKSVEALESYLACVDALKEDKDSLVQQTLLAPAFSRIAAIYYEAGEYDQGLRWIQAAKYVYESTLAAVDEAQTKEQRTKDAPVDADAKDVDADAAAAADDDDDTAAAAIDEDDEDAVKARLRDLDPSSVEATRLRLETKAKSLDRLSEMMVQAGQYELALDYASKGVHIRKHLYGIDHEATEASLANAGVAFAAHGRESYAAALANRERIRNMHKDVDSLTLSSAKQEEAERVREAKEKDTILPERKTDAPAPRPSAKGMRQRKRKEEEEKKNAAVHEDEESVGEDALAAPVRPPPPRADKGPRKGTRSTAAELLQALLLVCLMVVPVLIGIVYYKM